MLFSPLFGASRSFQLLNIFRLLLCHLKILRTPVGVRVLNKYSRFYLLPACLPFNVEYSLEFWWSDFWNKSYYYHHGVEIALNEWMKWMKIAFWMFIISTPILFAKKRCLKIICLLIELIICLFVCVWLVVFENYTLHYSVLLLHTSFSNDDIIR